MIRHRLAPLVIAFILAPLLALAGCVSADRRVQVAENAIESQNFQTDMLAEIARGQPNASQARIDIKESAFVDWRRKFHGDIAALREDLQRQREAFDQFVTGLGTIAGVAFPGADKIAVAAQSIVQSITGRAEEQKAALERARQALNDLVDERLRRMTEQLEAAREREQAERDARIARDAQAQRALADSLLGVERQAADLAARIDARPDAASIRAQIAEVIRASGLLSREEYLTSLREETIAEARKRGMSDAEISRIRAFSTEEWVALFGAGGLALAGFLRTLGKSRSAPELEKIKTQLEQLSDLKAEIDQLYDKTEGIRPVIAAAPRPTA
ncbi:MAG: hypothetical protein AB7K52_05030 [Phycisphaerales bacterium]